MTYPPEVVFNVPSHTYETENDKSAVKRPC